MEIINSTESEKDLTLTKSTQCIHAGSLIDPVTKGVVTPIYPSTAFDYIDTPIHAYPRYFNTPNQKVVVDKLCALENGEDGMVLSSGMAAISTVLFTILKKGDHAIFQNDLYGGTHHAINIEMEKFDINHTFVDIDDVQGFEDAIRPETKLIYIETPSNPLLKIIDIEAIAKIAKKHNIITVIDNTFASPINQNPLDLGIDIVIHSGTKYLGGHSDICCGAIITSKQLTEEIWGAAIHFGGSLNAETCYLLERSLKTLALRVNQQNHNAMAIAEYLENHPKIDQVYYPGLANHPGHKIAKKQMMGFGGMLSFEVAGNPDTFIQNLTLIKSAMSLGGVETTLCAPAKTSHSKMTAAARAEIGVKDNLIRLSVGIETTKDLIEDIANGLEKA